MRDYGEWFHAPPYRSAIGERLRFERAKRGIVSPAWRRRLVERRERWAATAWLERRLYEGITRNLRLAPGEAAMQPAYGIPGLHPICYDAAGYEAIRGQVERTLAEIGYGPPLVVVEPLTAEDRAARILRLTVEGVGLVTLLEQPEALQAEFRDFAVSIPEAGLFNLKGYETDGPTEL